MKKFIVLIAFVFLFLGLAYLYNTEERRLEQNFVSTANEMNRAIEEANRAIEYANSTMDEHRRAICNLSVYKLKKLVPETDEELKAKAIANCDELPAFVDTGWGMDFLIDIDNSLAHNPI